VPACGFALPAPRSRRLRPIAAPAAAAVADGANVMAVMRLVLVMAILREFIRRLRYCKASGE